MNSRIVNQEKRRVQQSPENPSNSFVRMQQTADQRKVNLFFQTKFQGQQGRSFEDKEELFQKLSHVSMHARYKQVNVRY